MYKVGMGVIRKYSNEVTVLGEIVSVEEDANNEILVTVMYTDGSTKVYTENAIDNPRMIVTEEVIW